MKNLIPLDQLGFGWRSHKSAMWWLSLAYWAPSKLNEASDKLSAWQGITSGFFLWLHSFPLVMTLIILGQLFVFHLLKLPYQNKPLAFSTLFFHVSWILGGLLAEISIVVFFLAFFGLVNNSVSGLPQGLYIGIVTAFALGTVGGIKGVGRFDIDSTILTFKFFLSGTGILCFVGLALAIYQEGLGVLNAKELFRVALILLLTPIFAAFFVWLAGARIAFAVFAIFGLIESDVIYKPIHLLFVWPRSRPKWYRYHPVSWKEENRTSYKKLHRLLVSLAEENQVEGKAEIDRLIENCPNQLDEALRAKVIITAREAQKLPDLCDLDSVLSQLPEGKKGYLAQTANIREWVGEISRRQNRLNIMTRSAFREPFAELLVKEIENFRHRISGLPEPLSNEFRVAATQWLTIAQDQLDEARRVTSNELTPQVFRAGDPANPESEAFVARDPVIGELEQQVMLSTGCPGLVLYARRRMGKSTILRNLTGFLPTDVVTAFFSMQKPQLFTSVESAVRALHDEIRLRLPSLPVSKTPPTDLSSFFSFLTACNAELETKGKRLLLAVDEYETIDAKIGEGVFPLGLLDTLRESIQTHRRITWIFAGSHEIYELTNAAWTSYLVSARTIEVPAFTEAETRLLLTEPMKHSTLWRNNEEKRPRFAASFWGEGGIERIHAEAGGWPHLVQLIAETIVDLVNLEEVSQVTPDLFERALDKSIVRGQNVLYELMHRESTLPGEWEYLLAFKKTETQPPPQDEKIAASLRRRLLVEESNGEWRLRVPLMARWLKLRGQ